MKHEMRVQLNGKEFVLDEITIGELFFLMDQDRIGWYLQSYGQNLQDFVNELKSVSDVE